MSRNIVKDYLDYNRSELLEYFKLIFDGKSSKGIPNKMVDIYINLRYYNLYNDNNITLINDIVNKIKKETFKYIQEENIKIDKIDNDIINALWILKYILCYDKAINDKKIMKSLNNLEDKVIKRNQKEDLVKIKIFPLIKKNHEIKEKFLKGCQCKDFKLDIKTTNLKDVYYADLISEVKIPELYSLSAVKKVYESGTVNEDKLLVFYTLISLQILDNILKFNYNSQYLVSFDCNILSKKNKCKQLFKIIDIDVLKECIIMRVSFEDFVCNKDVIYEYIHEGYKFAVIINDDFKENFQLLEVFEYIVLNGKIENVSKLKTIDNVVIMDLIGV